MELDHIQRPLHQQGLAGAADGVSGVVEAKEELLLAEEGVVGAVAVLRVNWIGNTSHESTRPPTYVLPYTSWQHSSPVRTSAEGAIPRVCACPPPSPERLGCETTKQWN